MRVAAVILTVQFYSSSHGRHHIGKTREQTLCAAEPRVPRASRHASFRPRIDSTEHTARITQQPRVRRGRRNGASESTAAARLTPRLTARHCRCGTSSFFIHLFFLTHHFVCHFPPSFLPHYETTPASRPPCGGTGDLPAVEHGSGTQPPKRQVEVRQQRTFRQREAQPRSLQCESQRWVVSPSRSTDCSGRAGNRCLPAAAGCRTGIQCSAPIRDWNSRTAFPSFTEHSDVWNTVAGGARRAPATGSSEAQRSATGRSQCLYLRDAPEARRARSKEHRAQSTRHRLKSTEVSTCNGSSAR